VGIGSVEGSGLILLGSNNLTVGSNNLSTTFSGIIQGSSGSGSLAKTGKGKFTLSNANAYGGGTTVVKGTLLVTNRTGSATGTGAVTVNAGTLGGRGKISGAVTIGTATSAAILAPGSGAKPGKLALSNTLTFNGRANYKVDLNSTLVTADQVTAKGVTINSGATVTLSELGTGTLTVGTFFTIINNTATTPIADNFSNLLDGGTLTIGKNTFQANYEGGDGNDLTLTVVP
jgi:autotransporter-associated beta strand protein